MSELPTPRTDSKRWLSNSGEEVVSVDVARELERELAEARETNQRLNRRLQAAERALPDYARIIALPPNGDGVRFVSGSFGRALLAWHAAQLSADRDRLRDCAGELAKAAKDASGLIDAMGTEDPDDIETMAAIERTSGIITGVLARHAQLLAGAPTQL